MVMFIYVLSYPATSGGWRHLQLAHCFDAIIVAESKTADNMQNSST